MFITSFNFIFCKNIYEEDKLLNCAKVKISEQSLKRALTKTLKSQINHQNTIKLSSSSEYTDLIFSYSPLTSDNIQLGFHDYTETLYINFVHLKATVTGKYLEEFRGNKIITEFTAKLSNFEWEQAFDQMLQNCILVIKNLHLLKNQELM